MENILNTPFEGFDFIDEDDDIQQDDQLEDTVDDEESEESEEQDDSGQDETSDDDESDDNATDGASEEDDIPLKAFIDDWRSKGFISEDLELPDDVSVSDLSTKIFEAQYEAYKKAAEAEAAMYKEDLLTKQGLAPKVIAIAEALAQGVAPETLQEGNIIDEMVSWEIDKDDDDSYENREKLMRAMYKHQGLNEKKIGRLVQTAQDNDEDLEEAKSAKDYFQKIKDDREAEDKTRYADYVKNQEKAQEDFLTSLKKTIETGDIMGGANKKEFFKDLTEPTQWIDIPTEDGKKEKRRVSLWNKKLLEYGVILNPTSEAAAKGDIKNFLNIAHIILYGDVGPENVKKRVKAEVENSLEAQLRKKAPTPRKQGNFIGAVDEKNLIL